ncbi:MAG: glycosyltransferase [Alphaproteobacteria bacterium]|jgi:undecaprenyl-phosphate 4-deoxy-4-formamido-L-arabinose transferase|nr:glycosyltransferase [Alphaproteobacteria bacterium]
MLKAINLSVVIPVYNEAENLPSLFQRLTETLDKTKKPYEIVFTNDGSSDASLDILKGFFKTRPDIVRIVDFHGNFGQHMAIMAAFEQTRGTLVVTLDADLQNPPEEIPKLLEKMGEGFDYVGSYRANRQDNFFRTYVSRLVNWFRETTTDIKMRDQGCMLRAYSRQIVDQIVKSQERSTFIPALAYKMSLNPTEVEVRHDARAAGVSKYNLYRLVRLNFDLITSFSLIPLQIFTLFGMVISGLSGLLVGYLLLRRLIIGPEAEGLFTLFAILIFLVSVVITGIGIIGEYLGRIFQTLSMRPRYVVRELIEKKK